MAHQTRDIQSKHKEMILESAAKAKMEADQEIKAIEKEIHQKNKDLNEDALCQRLLIQKIKKENEKLDKQNKLYKREMMINAETVEEYSKRQ